MFAYSHECVWSAEAIELLCAVGAQAPLGAEDKGPSVLSVHAGERGRLFALADDDSMQWRLLSLGLDICSAGRWHQLLAREPGALALAFTTAELGWAAETPTRLAALWSAKEAVVKALGCGFGNLSWRDVAVDLAAIPPQVQLPAIVPKEVPSQLQQSDMSWQFMSFWVGDLAGTLALVYRRGCDKRHKPIEGSSVASVIDKRSTVLVALQLAQARTKPNSSRAERRFAERVAARRAVQLAAARLMAKCNCRAVRVVKKASGQPVLWVPPGSPTPGNQFHLSLSHCSGWAAAGIGGNATRYCGSGRVAMIEGEALTAIERALPGLNTYYFN